MMWLQQVCPELANEGVEYEEPSEETSGVDGALCMMLAIDTRISQQQMETLKQALLEVRLLVKCISPTQSLKIVMQSICRQGELGESAVCATFHIQSMSVGRRSLRLRMAGRCLGC